MFYSKCLCLLFLALLQISIVFTIEPTNEKFLDPSYNPCQCDLTKGLCDLNCCCDGECSTADKALFVPQCRDTIRGLITNEIDEWFCNDIYGTIKLQKPNWFPIMCVNSMTTVLLGKFYSPITLDEFVSSDNFVSKVNRAIKSSYNYRSGYLNNLLITNTLIRKSTFCTLGNNVKYKYGDCVKRKQINSETEATGFFKFPKILNSLSTCDYSNPVRYLQNTGKSSCPINIDQSLSFCSKDSVANYEKYIATDLIIKNPLDHTQPISSIEFWKCDPYTTADPYPTLDLNPNSAKNCQGFNSTCQFSSKTLLFDDKFTGLCAEPSWEYATSRVNDIPLDFSSKLESKCTKVPDSRSITIPTKIGTSCSNTVTGVRSVFFWKEGIINRVLTKVFLADIPYKQTPATKVQKFNQNFELVWFHESSTPIDTSSVTTVQEYNSYQDILNIKYLNNGLHGKRANGTERVLGYIDGSVIISGHIKDSIIDIGYNQRISSYRTLNGKLCGKLSNLERTQILFNQNMHSSCMVRLTKADIENRCDCVRNLIFNKINDYFAPSNFVSKNGNPNLTTFDQADWLNVYPSSPRKFPNIDKVNITCSNVPYKILVEFFFAKSGKADGIDFSELVGVQIRYLYKDWRFVCKTDRSNCFKSDSVQDFEVEFEAKFINTTYTDPNKSFLEKCSEDPNYSLGCIQQALFTWPRDHRDANYFYLYIVHLSLIGAVFGLIIIYFMFIGLVCPF